MRHHPDKTVAAGLPVHHASTLDLPDDEAVERWRSIIGQSYSVDRAGPSSSPPRGGTTLYELDGFAANRTVFGVQRATRDRRLVDATPDHLILQFWRTGGYRGTVDGRPVVLQHGHVALANRRRTLDVRFAPSDTFGLIVPRRLLHGIPIDDLSTRLDPVRDRLATARLRSLHHLLPSAGAGEAARLSAEILAFLRRILDSSTAVDVLEGPEFDPDLVEMARRFIAAHLHSPTLAPDTIAAHLAVSRAGLYRAFAPYDGVMRCIWEMRLDALERALRDPLAERTLSALGRLHGFKSLAHLSRSFKQRFGVSPRAWREMHRDPGEGAGVLRIGRESAAYARRGRADRWQEGLRQAG